MKIVIFDLFDTLLMKVHFDYDSALQYLYQNYVNQDRYQYEDLKKRALQYRHQFMMNRKETHIEVSMNYQLSYYQYMFKDSISKNLQEIEEELMFVCRKEQLSDGCIDFLKYLKKWGYQLYIISNSIFSATTLKRYLEYFAILEFFDEVISSADCGYRKPSHEIFKYLEQSISVSLTNGIYFIGNSYDKDVKGAKNVGLSPILYGNDDQYLSFPHFNDIQDFFENNFVYYGEIKYNSYVDGPGIRAVIFLQGCDVACEKCHNQILWDTKNNTRISVEKLVNILDSTVVNKKITISGGEPLMQSKALANLLAKLQDFDLCLYTSYEEQCVPKSITKHLKYLKVGKFDYTKRNLSIPYIGSTNQRFIQIKNDSCFLGEVNEIHRKC